MAKELAKHKKYKTMYIENELFWGLGIEEETYLQFTKLIFVAAPIIRTCHTEERYSVNYYSSYKPDYKKYFEKKRKFGKKNLRLSFIYNHKKNPSS